MATMSFQDMPKGTLYLDDSGHLCAKVETGVGTDEYGAVVLAYSSDTSAAVLATLFEELSLDEFEVFGPEHFELFFGEGK